MPLVDDRPAGARGLLGGMTWFALPERNFVETASREFGLIGGNGGVGGKRGVQAIDKHGLPAHRAYRLLKLARTLRSRRRSLMAELEREVDLVFLHVKLAHARGLPATYPTVHSCDRCSRLSVQGYQPDVYAGDRAVWQWAEEHVGSLTRNDANALLVEADTLKFECAALEKSTHLVHDWLDQASAQMAELERAAAEVPLGDRYGDAHVHFADEHDERYAYPITPAPTPMPSYAYDARHSISGPHYGHPEPYYPHPHPSSRSYSTGYAPPPPLYYAPRGYSIAQPIGPALSHAAVHSHVGGHGGYHGLAHIAMAREHARLRRGPPPYPGQRGHYRFP